MGIPRDERGRMNHKQMLSNPHVKASLAFYNVMRQCKSYDDLEKADWSEVRFLDPKGNLCRVEVLGTDDQERKEEE